MSDEILVTYARAGELLSVSEKMIRRLVEKGDLPARMVLSVPRIAVSALHEYAERGNGWPMKYLGAAK